MNTPPTGIRIDSAAKTRAVMAMAFMAIPGSGGVHRLDIALWRLLPVTVEH